MNHTHLPIRFFFLVFVGLVSVILLINCKRGKKNSTDTKYRPDSTQSANVLFPKKLSEQEVRQLFAGIPGLPINDIKVRICPCDTGLTNIALPQDWIIIKGQDGGLTVKNTTSDAEGNIALPGSIGGLNYPISTFDFGDRLENTTQKLDANLAPLVTRATKTIKIAVFDSGLTSGFIPSAFSSDTTSMCAVIDSTLTPTMVSTTGWNFVTDRPDPTNTKHDAGDIVQHGSRVAYMLAKQFMGTTIAPHIIPMRILGKDNKGDLFGLLCAMETARKNGIKVFNMSLGYYGAEDAVFKKYVQRAIADNVWIVTAAGNRTASDPPAIDRNLTTMPLKFYPAYFSRVPEFNKLLVATTVVKSGTNTLVASDKQNFDKKYVLGILADNSQASVTGTGQEGRFFLEAPLGTSLRIFGTSYATPVLAGRLARLLADKPAASPNTLINLMASGSGGNEVLQNRYFPAHP